MLVDATGRPHALEDDEPPTAAVVLEIVKSLAIAVAEALGRRDEVALRMANALASRSIDPSVSPSEREASRRAGDEFRLRVLPQIITPP